MKTTTAEARWDENKRYWKVNVQQDGVRKSFYEKTEGRRGKRMCEAKAQEWLDDNCPTDMTFAVAWEKYLQSKEGTIAEATAKGYAGVARSKLLPMLGKKKLSKITVQDWQNCINEAAASGATYTTCQNLQSKIVSFVKFARRSRYPVEPVVELTIPKSAPKVSRTALQPEHLRILFSVDTTCLYGTTTLDTAIHAYRFGVLTGLRRGELVGLRWDDIADGVVTISRSITNDGKETAGKNDNAHRSFILPARALEELEQQKKLMVEHGFLSPWVFPDIGGYRMKPATLLYRWHRYCDTNGLPHFVFHELRHTAVSMYETALPEKLLKQTIGHSKSFDTHGVYGHKFGDEDRQAASAMDSVLDRILV